MQDAATAAHGSPIDDLVLGGGTKPVWAARPDGVKTQDLFASLRPGRKAADHSTREGYGPNRDRTLLRDRIARQVTGVH